jgi:tRNA threonylcarbamoyladenosine biosynthesis protein TsaE
MSLSKMTVLIKDLPDEQASVAMGRAIAERLTPPFTLYLTGELGAGKTTLSRGIIQALGHNGAVKSPTYTLVEPYELPGIEVFHFDLYRVADPEELEFMGIRDYFNNNSLCLVEWPDRGFGMLPAADLHLDLSYKGLQRQIKIEAKSAAGQNILDNLK